MVSAWPEADNDNADDRRRTATHRAICFQEGKGNSAFEPTTTAMSWCALFPLDSQPFTRADVVLRLDNDRATLLDLDQGAPVHAIRLQPADKWQLRPGNKWWEVRALEGAGVMVGREWWNWKPGFAEARGLLPLFIPRPGRTASPHATSLTPRGWSISPSIGSDESRQLGPSHITSSRLGKDLGTALYGLLLVVLVSIAVSTGHIVPAGMAVFVVGRLIARIADRWRSTKARQPAVRLEGPSTTLVDIDWRPANDGGCLAWILIDDDQHHRLEAPIAGLTPSSIDVFPAMTEIHGEIRPGSTIRATLPDGSSIQTSRPLSPSSEGLL